MASTKASGKVPVSKDLNLVLIKKYQIKSDDFEHDKTKYTGTCGKCKGRTCPDMDHIEDLVNRTVTSKHPFNAAYRLQYHWPHFADFNRMMQFFCPICKLHFRGAREFTVHTVRNQTEEGFKKDGPEQITWTEEIGVQHQALLKAFILLIKEIDANGPKAEQIRTLEQFLCSKGQRYFEIAFRKEKFAATTIPSNYDYDDDDMIPIEEETHLVTNDNPDAYKVEEVSSELLYGSVAYKRKLDQVFHGHVGKLSDLIEKQNGEGEKDLEEVKKVKAVPPRKPNTSRHGYTCPECNETSPSVRHHITQVMWTDKTKRWKHLDFFLDDPEKGNTIMTEYDAKTTSCVYCPSCNIHVRTWRAYQPLFNHFKRQDLYPKRKPNQFIRDHLDIMNGITDLFVERIKGDVSMDAMNNLLNEKFRCPNGGLYMDSEIVVPTRTTVNMKRHSSSASRNSRTKRLRQTAMAYYEEADPGFPMHGPMGPRPPFPRRPMGVPPRGPVPAAMPLRGPVPAAMPPRGPVPAAIPCVCELCGFETFGNDGMFQHLIQILFRSNLESISSHLLSFPKAFIYNKPCTCPSCGQMELSFVNLLQHIGRMGVRDPQHQIEAEALANQFLRCMNGIIDFKGVMGYIGRSCSMRGRNM